MTVESGQVLKKHLSLVQLCPLLPGGVRNPVVTQGRMNLRRGPEYGWEIQTGKGPCHA